MGRSQPRHGPGLDPGPAPDSSGTPRFDALGRWLLARTAEVSTGRPGVVVEPEATVFTNIAPGSADVVRPWVDALRNVGFRVLRQAEIDEDSDVDRDMLEHIELRRREGLAALVWHPLTAKRSVYRWKKSHHRGRWCNPCPGDRISRTRELGTSVGYLGLR